MFKEFDDLLAVNCQANIDRGIAIACRSAVPETRHISKFALV